MEACTHTQKNLRVCTLNVLKLSPLSLLDVREVQPYCKLPPHLLLGIQPSRTLQSLRQHPVSKNRSR